MPALAACVLIGTGMSAKDAISLINEKWAVANPDIWYIQKHIHKFENEGQDLNSKYPA